MPCGQSEHDPSMIRSARIRKFDVCEFGPRIPSHASSQKLYHVPCLMPTGGWAGVVTYVGLVGVFALVCLPGPASQLWCKWFLYRLRAFHFSLFSLVFMIVQYSIRSQVGSGFDVRPFLAMSVVVRNGLVESHVRFVYMKQSGCFWSSVFCSLRIGPKWGKFPCLTRAYDV